MYFGVYDIKDSVRTCKTSKARVNTGKMKNAGGYTRITVFGCLIFGWDNTLYEKVYSFYY